MPSTPHGFSPLCASYSRRRRSRVVEWVMILRVRECHKAGDAGGHYDRCWAPCYIAKNLKSLLGRFTMPISIVLGSRRTGRSRWIDTNRLYASRLSLIAFTLPASVEGGCKRIPGFKCRTQRAQPELLRTCRQRSSAMWSTSSTDVHEAQ